MYNLYIYICIKSMSHLVKFPSVQTLPEICFLARNRSSLGFLQLVGEEDLAQIQNGSPFEITARLRLKRSDRSFNQTHRMQPKWPNKVSQPFHSLNATDPRCNQNTRHEPRGFAFSLAVSLAPVPKECAGKLGRVESAWAPRPRSLGASFRIRNKLAAAQMGQESKLEHQQTAGFSPWFHLLGFQKSCPFLTHSQITVY